MIYELYPRKQARQAGLKAIRAALKVKTVTQLTESVTAFAAAVARWPAADRARFIPHPATWFNAGSYDDDRAMWVRREVDRNGHLLPAPLPPPAPAAWDAECPNWRDLMSDTACRVPDGAFFTDAWSGLDQANRKEAWKRHAAQAAKSA